MENEGQVVEGAESLVGNEGGEGNQRDWAKEGPELENRLKQYEKDVESYKPYKEWTERVYSYYQKNQDFKKVLEDVLGGKEFKLGGTQAPTNPNPAAAKPQLDPETMKRLEKIDALEKQYQSFERQQKTSENLREIQTEAGSIKEKFNATDEEMNEFWNRLGGQIAQDAQRILQGNPSIPPQTAQIMAAQRYANVITSKFIELMPEKMSEFYSARSGQRQVSQKGVNTPADRVKKGSSPSRLEQLQNVIANSPDSKERAQARLDLADELGVDPAELFAGKRAGAGR